MEAMNGLRSWIGLVNLRGYQCKGPDCDGKVNWYDGSSFNHASWMGDSFPDFSTGSPCIWMNEDFTFGQGPCTTDVEAMCTYDCSGYSKEGCHFQRRN